MAFRTTRLAVLLATLPLAGCGTLANVANSRTEEGGRIPFGGTKHDLQCLRGATSGEIGYRGHARPADEAYPRTALGLFCAADLPLSAVADTVLWPYTATYTRVNAPVGYPPIGIGETPPLQGAAVTSPQAVGPPPPVTPPATLPPMPPATPPQIPAIRPDGP